MKKLILTTLVTASSLMVAAPAQALTKPYFPKQVPKWTLTPTPNRPLLPHPNPQRPNVPILNIPCSGSPGHLVAEGGGPCMWYDLPGPFVLWRGESLLKAASAWYPIGSYINLRMPPHSTFTAEGVTRGLPNASRCMWTNPVVVDEISRGTKTYGVGEWSIAWRVKATNRGNEVTVTGSPPSRTGTSLEYWVNYSNAYIRITIRCAPVGIQDQLIDIGGGVLVGASPGT